MTAPQHAAILMEELSSLLPVGEVSVLLTVLPGSQEGRWSPPNPGPTRPQPLPEAVLAVNWYATVHLKDGYFHVPIWPGR